MAGAIKSPDPALRKAPENRAGGLAVSRVRRVGRRCSRTVASTSKVGRRPRTSQLVAANLKSNM